MEVFVCLAVNAAEDPEGIDVRVEGIEEIGA
jgi:hypothetical protein